jgi:hypothetical protein
MTITHNCLASKVDQFEQFQTVWQYNNYHGKVMGKITSSFANTCKTLKIFLTFLTFLTFFDFSDFFDFFDFF